MKRSFDSDRLNPLGIMGGFDLEEFAAIYPQQWLAVAVLEEDRGRPVRGYLLAHGQDRARVEKSLHALSKQRILFFYNGAKSGSSNSSNASA